MSPDFTKKTIDTLAKRAAFRCSNPDCRVTTAGPNSDPGKSTVIGEAGHIFGARSGAKRFKSEMSDSARAEITNAIWLCRNCHKLVDTDAQKYSSEILFAWREQHEKYVHSTLGSSSEKIEYEQQSSQVSQFNGYPPIIRRIVIDKPRGWEWRLTAELMRHLNGPLFRKLSDLRDGLIIKPQQHIAEDEVLGWVRERIAELENLVHPLSGLLDRLTQSWGAPGEPGNLEEIHHICHLIRDYLEQVVYFEEQVRFVNTPREYDNVINMFKDALGSQVKKLSDIPNFLDETVALAKEEGGENREDVRVIRRTISIDLPDGWGKKLVRELEHAQQASLSDNDSKENRSSFWTTFWIVFILFWLLIIFL